MKSNYYFWMGLFYCLIAVIFFKLWIQNKKLETVREWQGSLEPLKWEGRTVYGIDGKPLPSPMRWDGRAMTDSNGNVRGGK